jgi:hypothetical protein
MVLLTSQYIHLTMEDPLTHPFSPKNYSLKIIWDNLWINMLKYEIIRKSRRMTFKVEKMIGRKRLMSKVGIITLVIVSLITSSCAKRSLTVSCRLQPSYFGCRTDITFLRTGWGISKRIISLKILSKVFVLLLLLLLLLIVLKL